MAQIDVDLDIFEENEIVDYIVDSFDSLSNKNQNRIKEVVGEVFGNSLLFRVETLEDELKVEHLRNVFKNYSAVEIENMLKLK